MTCSLKNMAATGGTGLIASANDNNDIPVYEYADINTKQFHVGTFGSLWKENLKPGYYSFQDTQEETEDAEFAEETGVASETLDELKVICSPETLKSDPQDDCIDKDVVPPNPTLHTLRLRKRRQDYKSTLLRDLTCRQDLYANELESLAMGKRPSNPEDLVPEGELILSVNVLYPVLFERFKYVRHHQTLQVMGSQKLTELRDAVCCVSDLQVSGEFSNMPDMVPEFISKDHYKSAFFYLEGVFYNDLRYPECRDLSQTVLEWAKTRDLPAFQIAKMEDTTFNELKIKIGYPYLYCHQGDCEHVVIFTDIRLAHRDDCLDQNLFPLLTYKHRVVTRKCSVCHLYISRWITTNDSLAPMDPCLFCDTCFRMLHYDGEGNKIGDFLAFPYVDAGVFN